MAQLPRYQETGLVSGDIPRLDFANLREQAQGIQSISGALDRVSQFAFGEALKEKEKADKLTAIQVRSELESVVQKRIAELTIKVETGELADFNAIQTEVQSLSGLADGLKGLDIDQANGLLSSIRQSGKALMAKSSDMIVNNYRAIKATEVRSNLDSAERNLQTEFEVDQDPNSMLVKIDNQRRRVAASAYQANNLDESMKEFEKRVSIARSNAISTYVTSPEFATNSTQAIEMLSSGNVGKYSAIWKGMSEEEKQGVFDRIKKASERRRTLMDSEFSTAEAKAAPLVRQLLSTDDPAKRRELVGKLEGLPLSPDKLKTYQGYVDDAGAFAKVDDANLLLTLTRKAASGVLNDDELLKNRGRLTKETFNSLVRNIANPNENLKNFNQVFDRTVGIQSANLPPELPTAEGRAAAVAARNSAILELEKYANTPVNGVLPSSSEVSAKGREIQTRLANGMTDVFSKAADTTQADAVALVPDLNGVDLTNDAAVDQAMAKYLERNKRGQGAVQAARESIARYRQYKLKVPSK